MSILTRDECYAFDVYRKSIPVDFSFMLHSCSIFKNRFKENRKVTHTRECRRELSTDGRNYRHFQFQRDITLHIFHTDDLDGHEYPEKLSSCVTNDDSTGSGSITFVLHPRAVHETG